MLYPIELRARSSPDDDGGEERIRTSGPVLPDQPLSRRLPSATRPPLQNRRLAEGVGFEPTELSLSGFQDRRLKPLGHPSATEGRVVVGRWNLASFRRV